MNLDFGERERDRASVIRLMTLVIALALPGNYSFRVSAETANV